MKKLVAIVVFFLLTAGGAIAGEAKGRVWFDKDGCKHYPCPPINCAKCPTPEPPPPDCGKCPAPPNDCTKCPVPVNDCTKCAPKMITEIRGVLVPEIPKGRWYVPASLFYVNGWGLGTGVGYKFPRGLTIAGQALWQNQRGEGGGSAFVVCDTDFGDSYGNGFKCPQPEPKCKTLACPTCEGGSHWGAGVTIMIPLGR